MKYVLLIIYIIAAFMTGMSYQKISQPTIDNHSYHMGCLDAAINLMSDTGKTCTDMYKITLKELEER